MRTAEPLSTAVEPSINQFHGWLAEARLAETRRRARDSDLLMSLHLDRIDWMPSPPLVPDDGPIDIAHLRRMTLGDARLEREVLSMFSAQAVRLAEALAAMPPDATALAHTLKGSARAVGAFAVADAAAHLETLIKAGGDTADTLSDLDSAVEAATSAIDAFLSQAD